MSTGVRYSKREKKGAVFAFMLLAFPIIQFLIFYVYINLSSFILAFQDREGVFTFENFITVYNNFFNVYGEASLLIPLKRSFITWGFNILVIFPISILITYALFKKVWGEKFFRIILFMPSLLGAIVFTTLFKEMVAADGPLLKALSLLNIPVSESVRTVGFLGSPESAFKTILFYAFWTGLGSTIIILTGALTRIPKEIFESAQLDGAGFLVEMFRLALPLIWPSISTLIIFQLSMIFMADGGTFLLVGTNGSFLNVSTMGYELFMILYNLSLSGNQSALVFGYPAAIGMVITVITMPVVLTVRYFINKYVDEVTY